MSQKTEIELDPIDENILAIIDKHPEGVRFYVIREELSKTMDVADTPPSTVYRRVIRLEKHEKIDVKREQMVYRCYPKKKETGN